MTGGNTTTRLKYFMDNISLELTTTRNSVYKETWRLSVERIDGDAKVLHSIFCAIAVIHCIGSTSSNIR